MGTHEGYPRINTVDERGWYICIRNHDYLNNDGSVTYGIKSEKESFWRTKEEAEKALVEYENKGWYQIKSYGELSIGQEYFYFFANGKQPMLSTFDGEGFSCEQESFEFEDDFDYSNFWLMDFVWPSPPNARQNN